MGADLAIGAGTTYTWVRALRLHQWSKNSLVFAPLIAAHAVTHRQALLAAAWAFLAFGLCASAGYLFNDIVDREADRRHPRKQLRPIASGAITLGQARVALVVLVCGAFTLAASTLPLEFALTLAIYLLLSLWYSIALKRIALLDTVLLGGLYTARVIAGGFATAVSPSFWLLAFSMFLFLSLAMAKRYAELQRALGQEGGAVHGRGYSVHDMPLMLSCGVASGFIAALVLAFYVNLGAAQDYSRAQLLWLLCVLQIYWIGRVWLETTRGRMHDDPVVFALSDGPSLSVALIGMGLVWLAI